ncbi:hypothetical protein EPUS_06874 [Endocarpon pusillum Z07020]|uniref:Uncharacterized protein n=1 Tax=Endocarpon pusillum (strain Z07020 / HMAS-L-300199) TaxID=1263415 RepID=U1GXZ4_ENDPU|nr:uncharacterized protein EPUS_06874 [Endocarpon pusillum Z07020]ERF77006.1 hypothetical protein EPUS_06874 [Endocarpon pusillum Z07020]
MATLPSCVLRRATVSREIHTESVDTSPGQLYLQRQDQYQPEEQQGHQEHRKEQEEQEEQEEQNRQEQQQWEATQTLCGPLADLHGDLIASPSPQASNMPSTTVTAPALILPNFGLPTAEAEILEPQTDNTSARHLPRDQPLIDDYEADTNHQGGADDIKEDWHLSGQG